MRFAGWLTIAMAACAGAPDTTPTSDAVTVTDTDDPGELLSDVQHLLGEAVAQYEAEQRVPAQQSWLLATAILRDHLLEPMRAHDRRAALEIEYRLGRFGDALRRANSRPATAQKALDRALEAQRAVIVAWHTEHRRAEANP